MSEKHEYLREEDYYECNSVGKGRIEKTCSHCGKTIGKGTSHDVHKFYPDFDSEPTHKKCTDEFMKSLN